MNQSYVDGQCAVAEQGFDFAQKDRDNIGAAFAIHLNELDPIELFWQRQFTVGRLPAELAAKMPVPIDAIDLFQQVSNVMNYGAPLAAVTGGPSGGEQHKLLAGSG